MQLRDKQRQRVRKMAQHLATMDGRYLRFASWSACIVGQLPEVMPEQFGRDWLDKPVRKLLGVRVPFLSVASFKFAKRFFGLPERYFGGHGATPWLVSWWDLTNDTYNTHHVATTLLEAIGDCGPQPLWRDPSQARSFKPEVAVATV